VITSEQERKFYDGKFREFLRLPDGALRTNRQVMLGNYDDPQNPYYERRALYRAAMRALEAEPLQGRRVLDYGCGTADFGVWMATEGAEVTLLDLSPAAIELGLRRAVASGAAERVKGVAADASRLDVFDDESFDLVFACASLHHTMKYPGAVEELARVMRPGARLVLCEPWGGNPMLNWLRRLWAACSGEEEAQGEDIIMSPRELRQLEPWYGEFHVEHLNLLAMAKRMLRGRFGKAWARAVLRALEIADRAVLAVCPPLKNWCGESIITARRRGL
jgi:ubiquinone/menaquinone biosynthesis C-methylase UbiE